MSDIQSIIKGHLSNLETSHNIRILFACESGSRAWGFPSPDSDYDVRFVYVHKPDWYLSIQEHRDVIEMPIDAELDIGGWDLRKALRLIAKRNSVLFEWIQSPIFYFIDEEFLKGFTEATSLYFSPITALHHYLSSAKKYYEDCLNDQVKLKKYFYCLRCTLASAWITHYQTIPPIEIRKLLAMMTDQALVNRILELIDLKAVHRESYLHPQEPQLQDYLMTTIAQCEQTASSLHSSKATIEPLNAFFRKVVKQHGY